MRRMAGGDPAAVVMLYKEFGEPMRAAVSRHARAMGATHLTLEDIDGLAFDVADDLRTVAAAWDPAGGALPWNWAEKRVRTLVRSRIGQYADSWDDERHGAEFIEIGPGDDEGLGSGVGADLDEELLLARLAELDDRCALLREGLELVASARDRGVFLLAELQQAMGDPSPANTVAESFAMSPAAVRKAVQRVRDRLAALASRDARFEPIRDLHIVCRCSAA